MTHQPSATQKSTMGLHYFSILNWFHKTFPEKFYRRLEDLKEKSKLSEKSPKMSSQKLFGPIVCKTLNVIAESAFLSVVTKINVKRQLFTGQILNVFEPRPHRPLGGARLFCDVASWAGWVGGAGIHCRWLRDQECSLINVPLGGNFHASSYPIDPPSSCEFAMLEFCGGYCKKKAKRETYFCSLLVLFTALFWLKVEKVDLRIKKAL